MKSHQYNKSLSVIDLLRFYHTKKNFPNFILFSQNEMLLGKISYMNGRE